MKTRLLIDGAAHTGCYRVECDCGDVWHGQGEVAGVAAWSPALPIAECVVHMRECHSGAFLDLQFSERFRHWLIAYWERANLRLMRHATGSEFGRTGAARA
jgi:hypothetical protein